MIDMVRIALWPLLSLFPLLRWFGGRRRVKRGKGARWRLTQAETERKKKKKQKHSCETSRERLEKFVPEIYPAQTAMKKLRQEEL